MKSVSLSVRNESKNGKKAQKMSKYVQISQRKIEKNENVKKILCKYSKKNTKLI